MINALDNLLRQLFMTRIPGLTTDDQVRVQPPDEDWRTHVSNLNGNALNIYLVELRENLKLRSNERMMSTLNGFATMSWAPRRIDCHYLITAWSPVRVTPAVEPTLDEHALLHRVTSVLMNHQPLSPREVYAPGPLPAGFPALIADAALPTTVLPAEGFAKYAEFWGTMGQKDHPWRPAVYLVATLPVALDPQPAVPIVTTGTIEFLQRGIAATAEAVALIGGAVLDKAGQALPGSWVRLETTGGQPVATATADGLGRFVFDVAALGAYRLRARAVGRGEVVRLVEVPSGSGEYDLRFP
jgi:hypothetical protein